jgi:hypothetical protein
MDLSHTIDGYPESKGCIVPVAPLEPLGRGAGQVRGASPVAPGPSMSRVRGAFERRP